MCFKSNRRFKSKRVYHDYRNKCIKNINKAYIMQIMQINGISCKCKCNFDGRKCDSDQRWNNDKSRCECKKRHVCEKDHIWNPATCSCEIGKYLASIMVDSVITCDEIIESYNEETKTIPTNFNEK